VTSHCRQTKVLMPIQPIESCLDQLLPDCLTSFHPTTRLLTVLAVLDSFLSSGPFTCFRHCLVCSTLNSSADLILTLTSLEWPCLTPSKVVSPLTPFPTSSYFSHCTCLCQPNLCLFAYFVPSSYFYPYFC
jgi:hypothetical protein